MPENSNDLKKFSNQFEYMGEGPLDSKQQPIPTESLLPSKLKAYEGQTITVLSDNDGLTTDWIFINGNWKKKMESVDCQEW